MDMYIERRQRQNLGGGEAGADGGALDVEQLPLSLLPGLLDALHEGRELGDAALPGHPKPHENQETPEEALGDEVGGEEAEPEGRRGQLGLVLEEDSDGLAEGGGAGVEAGQELDGVLPLQALFRFSVQIEVGGLEVGNGGFGVDSAEDLSVAELEGVAGGNALDVHVSEGGVVLLVPVGESFGVEGDEGGDEVAVRDELLSKEARANLLIHPQSASG